MKGHSGFSHATALNAWLLHIFDVIHWPVFLGLFLAPLFGSLAFANGVPLQERASIPSSSTNFAKDIRTVDYSVAWWFLPPTPQPVTGTVLTSRASHTATLLPNGKVLVVGGTTDGVARLATSVVFDPTNSKQIPTSNTLTHARAWHSATMLPTGKVLVVGGATESTYFETPELYDPVLNSWSPAADELYGRSRKRHTSTLLPNGKVLVVGGENWSGWLNIADIYDPTTNSWTQAASMTTKRADHTATLLRNGKILVTGGVNLAGDVASAEIYDPGTDTWQPAGSLSTPRKGHTATLLPNGSVLVVGGTLVTSDVEIYQLSIYLGGSPWTSLPTTLVPTAYHTATLLPTGKVLIAGGSNSGGMLADSFLYDLASNDRIRANLRYPRSGHAATLLINGTVLATGGSSVAPVEFFAPQFTLNSTAAKSLSIARDSHTANLLPSGKVLVAGGVGSAVLASSELYDATLDTWSTAGSLSTARYGHTSTLLTNGQVLVVGGAGSDFYTLLPNAELYNSTANTWSSGGNLAVSRRNHTSTLLANGKVLVVGGNNGSLNSPFSSVELYDPATNAWTPAKPLSSGRSLHTATLLANGKVLVAGGRGASGALMSVELYEPGTNTWSAVASLNKARYGHTATLMPSGEVLVAYGEGIDTSGIPDLERYDPSTNRWQEFGTNLTLLIINGKNGYLSGHKATLLPNGDVFMGWQGSSYFTLLNTEVFYYTGTSSNLDFGIAHTETLLPNGKMLFVGGNKGSAQNTVNLVDVGMVPDANRQPTLTSVTDSLSGINVLQASGSGFRPNGEASGSASNNSATNYPLVQVRSIEGGQTLWLSADQNPMVPFTNTSFQSGSNLLTTFPDGYVFVTIFVDGIPSASQLSLLLQPPLAPGVPTIARLMPLNHGMRVFVTPPASNGSPPINGYVATCYGGGNSFSARSNTSPITITGLTNGISYTCYVRASNSMGDGTDSSTASKKAGSAGMPWLMLLI